MKSSSSRASSYKRGKKITKAEYYLELNQKDTPTYPFYKDPNGNLFFQTRHKLSLAMFILFLIFLITFLLVGFLESWFNNYTFILGALVIIFLFETINYYPVRTYVIEYGKRYQFYKGNVCIVNGPISDIYIRLKKKEEAEKPHYYLVLDGIEIEEVQITYYGKSIPIMRKLGKNIANRLNINYFDIENYSPHHEVIHPGQNTTIDGDFQYNENFSTNCHSFSSENSESFSSFYSSDS
ncbi:transmembrane protein 249-like protein [Tritrichomonas foetus]|uniref:Transmembrane protein 249-like protein n=1 Tax=Tritrichomonas foetus TaxID=1144522 RepID=A0A1J4JGS3_9EUKA|nr:transmembrane protein 249-like protein [Tritrichomonas foetus]|eukprot:OHS98374.1 transmembrane protein 249-like protein [Tritrichomonas foetus]